MHQWVRSWEKVLSKRREGIQPWERFPRGLSLRGTLFCGPLPKLSAAGRELGPGVCPSSTFSFFLVPSASFPSHLCVFCFFFSSSVFSPSYTSFPLFPTCLSVFLLARARDAPRPFHKILVTVHPALDGPCRWKAKVNADTWDPQPCSLKHSRWILSLRAFEGHADKYSCLFRLIY